MTHAVCVVISLWLVRQQQVRPHALITTPWQQVSRSPAPTKTRSSPSVFDISDLYTIRYHFFHKSKGKRSIFFFWTLDNGGCRNGLFLVQVVHHNVCGRAGEAKDLMIHRNKVKRLDIHSLSCQELDEKINTTLISVSDLMHVSLKPAADSLSLAQRLKTVANRYSSLALP